MGVRLFGGYDQGVGLACEGLVLLGDGPGGVSGAYGIFAEEDEGGGWGCAGCGEGGEEWWPATGSRCAD